jgi:hypothetical protein
MPIVRPNKIQAVTCGLCGIALLFLVLFPPWQQAAEKEVSYRKNIGRGLLWKPPQPVAVECYFVGCVTAPASYFHVLLHRKLLMQQCLTVLCVAMAFLWTFRTSKGGKMASLGVRSTRLSTSFLLALLIPPTGDVPFGAVLFGIPMVLVQRDELWLIPTIMALVMYFACALLMYGFLNAAVRIKN